MAPSPSSSPLAFPRRDVVIERHDAGKLTAARDQFAASPEYFTCNWSVENAGQFGKDMLTPGHVFGGALAPEEPYYISAILQKDPQAQAAFLAAVPVAEHPLIENARHDDQIWLFVGANPDTATMKDVGGDAAKSKVLCENGHVLRQVEGVLNAVTSCDKCGVATHALVKGTYTASGNPNPHRCKQCDYDLCDSCHNEAGSKCIEKSCALQSKKQKGRKRKRPERVPPLAGRPEHVDDVDHDGTWHLQLSGTKTWYIKPNKDSEAWTNGPPELRADAAGVVKPGNSTQGGLRCRVHTKAGDLLCVNTRAWWHRTEIESGPDLSISYARDLYLGSEMVATMPLLSPGDFEAGEVVLEEDAIPDHLEWSEDPNCTMAEVDNGDVDDEEVFVVLPVIHTHVYVYACVCVYTHTCTCMYVCVQKMCDRKGHYIMYLYNMCVCVSPNVIIGPPCCRMPEWLC
jgi:hypothetical protein